MIGLITDTGGSLVAEVATALVIFGILLGGIAWPLLGPLGRAATAMDGERNASKDGTEYV